MSTLGITQLWALGEELYKRQTIENSLSSRAEECYSKAVVSKTSYLATRVEKRVG